jgi:hypothetical protein
MVRAASAGFLARLIVSPSLVAAIEDVHPKHGDV